MAGISAKFFAVLMAIVSFFLGFSSKTMTITVDKNTVEQPFYGWGTSACWWSQNVSDDETREELAKYLYSKDGLGLNIYRYNVGGGVNPEHNRLDAESWRNTESFLVYNEESGKFEYDFTRDENAQKFLFKSLEYGCIDTVVLFANSPHYSMTKSGEASGSTSPKHKTNLDESQYQAFVDYFLDITEYFISKGVPVKYISPFNEPQWKWGGDVYQEGCHYSKKEAYELMKLFSKGIDERNLDVKLSAPEGGCISEETKSYMRRIRNDKDVAKNVGSYSYHSYKADENQMTKWNFGRYRSNSKYKNERVEMTEWCELPCQHSVNDFGGALVMARVIAGDTALSKVNSWSSWVAVNEGNPTGNLSEDFADGLFCADHDFENYVMAERYYAMAHFTKFVPTGSYIIKSKSNNFAAASKTNFSAFKTPDGEVVLVIVNEDVAKDINLSVDGKEMDIHTSTADKKLENTYSGELKKTINVPASSITTVVVK